MYSVRFEQERLKPKDGKPPPNNVKQDGTLVEVCSGCDVQSASSSWGMGVGRMEGFSTDNGGTESCRCLLEQFSNSAIQQLPTPRHSVNLSA
jgi:hypothetical protein